MPLVGLGEEDWTTTTAPPTRHWWINCKTFFREKMWSLYRCCGLPRSFLSARNNCQACFQVYRLIDWLICLTNGFFRLISHAVIHFWRQFLSQDYPQLTQKLFSHSGVVSALLQNIALMEPRCAFAVVRFPLPCHCILYFPMWSINAIYLHHSKSSRCIGLRRNAFVTFAFIQNFHLPLHSRQSCKSLIDWLIDWLVNWVLIDRLIDWWLY